MTLPKAKKSPLRYPGGKTRAVKTLLPRIPSDVTQYREPFLGGGSMAIAMTREYPDLPIWVNDSYRNLAIFWQVLQSDAQDLSDALLGAKAKATVTNTGRDLFFRCKEEINAEGDRLKRAKMFYILNKCSFSGLGESSGYSEMAFGSNFSVKNIESLPAFGEHIKNWTITCLDFEELINDDPHTAIYLDPPYYKVGKNGGSFLYGKDGSQHKGFDHRRLADAVDHSRSSVLISYDNNDEIRERYLGWCQESFDLTYTMHSGASYREQEAARKELVLYNYINE